MSEIRTFNGNEAERIMAEARRLQSEQLLAIALRLGRALVRFAGAIGTAFVEARRQQALYESMSRMTDRELRDIGLTRADIPAVVAGVRTREGEKPATTGTAGKAAPAPVIAPAPLPQPAHPMAA